MSDRVEVTAYDGLTNLSQEIELSGLFVAQKYGKLVSKCGFRSTSDERFLCTDLPCHIRVKIAVKVPFKLFALVPNVVPNRTKVTLTASSLHNPSAKLQNYESVMINQIAEFSKLKFLGKSGRGTKFDLTITIHTEPAIIVKVSNAVKVTADGIRQPRKPRANNKEKRPRGRPKKVPVTQEMAAESSLKISTPNKESAISTNPNSGRVSVIVPFSWDVPSNSSTEVTFLVQEKEDRPLEFLEDRGSLFAQWGRKGFTDELFGLSPTTSISSTQETISPTTCTNTTTLSSDFDFPIDYSVSNRKQKTGCEAVSLTDTSLLLQKQLLVNLAQPSVITNSSCSNQFFLMMHSNPYLFGCFSEM
ncbi:unnamed protein product [Enterobius vermicularis]|uniref:Runt domain-containing protein n=1 Tax=Enterobius vermicularis TaxID=51028 RepID=A0A0N4V762_ENTVE|nr:unnamed protein product [Enterobius vermicularis]